MEAQSSLRRTSRIATTTAMRTTMARRIPGMASARFLKLNNAVITVRQEGRKGCPCPRLNAKLDAAGYDQQLQTRDFFNESVTRCKQSLQGYESLNQNRALETVHPAL